MQRLSGVLWCERELLGDLVYRLEQERSVLADGRTRWLPRAAREVDEVLETLRETELLRAVTSDEAASDLGLAANPSLRALAVAASGPWPTILLDHRDAFLSHVREVSELAVINDELLGTWASEDRGTATAARPAGPACSGTARRRQNPAPASQVVVAQLQQAAYLSARAATGHVVQPSLLEFLR
ncbi:MAG: flagellar export chaperone FlgN [Nocardioides sp.]|nr:flagellar export chaperone FlgN [Nocardioides sp.]